MELATQVSELMAVLPKLPASKIEFACSLVSQFNRRKCLSPAQEPWIGKLLAIAQGTALAPQTLAVGNFAGVISLFRAASLKLKYPKIRIQVDGTPIVLSLAGERSKAPGSINLAGEGGWNDRAWYGRVSPQGTFDPSRSITPEFSAQLIPVLQELSNDPFATVQKYGRLTGHCMFCGLTLTDARSKVTGCGETCASHWGLSAQWKQALKNCPVPLTGTL